MINININIIIIIIIIIIVIINLQCIRWNHFWQINLFFMWFFKGAAQELLKVANARR